MTILTEEYKDERISLISILGLILPLVYVLAESSMFLNLESLIVWGLLTCVPFLLYIVSFVVIAKGDKRRYNILPVVVLLVMFISTVGLIMTLYKGIMAFAGSVANKEYVYESFLVALSAVSGAIISLETVKLVCKNKELICPQQDRQTCPIQSSR